MEKCLSKATEEYMRGMLQNIIKLSNQRCDSWKDKHKVVVTTNVWRDVLLKRKKDKEALEKKQEEKEALEKNLAELKERLQKLTEKKNIGTLADLAERRAKRQKIREEEEAKRQQIREEEEAKREVSATNKAARRALGADDMLSKWAKLAEQGWQKRQGGDGRPQHNRPVTTTGRPPGPGPGSASAGGSPSTQVERSQRLITMKDVLAAMERDIHLGKSTLLYELYERDRKTSSYVADRTITRSHLLADGTVTKR